VRMGGLDQPFLPWTPVSGGGFRSILGRFISFWAYPALLPYAVFSHCPATVANAKWFRAYFAILGSAGSIVGHTFLYRKFAGSDRGSTLYHALAHLLWAATWDDPYAWLCGISHQLIKIFSVNRTENRLNAGRLKGPKVLIVGNGPSAVEGEPFGERIDQFDEVVHFNNFQTKAAGMERWVGSKTTVHFSDGVLYPTFTEYHVPGADIVLSLFVDRYMVAGSYVILRAGADLQYRLTSRFLMHPDTTWIEKADIDVLKKELGLKGVKHPTSGMLAIHYFVNKPGVELPVYIHGFDFFMGPKIHYFHDHEPLYERLNNNIGVNMHSPHLEKLYVEKLIAEGKVRFLKEKVG